MSNELVRTLSDAFTEVGGTALIVSLFVLWGWIDHRRHQQRNDK